MNQPSTSYIGRLRSAPQWPIEWATDAIAARRDRRSTAEAPQRTKRPDIQGLRCVAVGLVILFHAGWGRLAGGFVGVDVFFVISGFLITGIITRQLAVQGDFSLVGFYANRARRLLPAAFVAIAATTLLVYEYLPSNRFNTLAHDAMASSYYGLNWRLANQAVDYLAQQQSPSPFQHFWSLGVEEQFYLVWPLLLLAAAVAARRKEAWRRPIFTAALTVVFVPSLIYSVTETASNPAQAYFVTPTRMWELALGGGVALYVEYAARIPRVVAAAIGWLGLAAIGASAVLYTGATPFPGSAALLPTLGSAAVLAFGQTAGRAGPARLLDLKPLQFIGDISYSLYLWHYPLIVLAAHRYADHAPLWVGLAAGFGAIIPAYLSYRFIERPALARGEAQGPIAGLRLGLNFSGAALIAGMLLLSAIPGPHSTILVGASGNAIDINGQTIKIGAETLTSNPLSGVPRDKFPTINPDPVDAEHDIPDGGHCIALLTDSNDVRCQFGVQDSKTTIELVGDSHAMQWLPALLITANRLGWRVITHTKQSCPFTNVEITSKVGAYTECSQWNSAVKTSILRDKPTLVLAGQQRNYRVWVNGASDSVTNSVVPLATGYETAWDGLISAGIKVAVLADTPRPDYDIVGCVDTHRSHLTACARPRSVIVPHDAALARALHDRPSVRLLDLNRYICPAAQCAAVIGSVLVYRDGNHMTATYAGTLARRLEPLVTPLVR